MHILFSTTVYIYTIDRNLAFQVWELHTHGPARQPNAVAGQQEMPKEKLAYHREVSIIDWFLHDLIYREAFYMF